jgi:cysteine desulfurase/selenocysteine lyase
LALGREASKTGSFDVAELSRIANELYAEGFPAGSPLASGGAESAIPSNASLSPAVSDSLIPANIAPAATPSSKATLADVQVPAAQIGTGFNDYLPSKEVELNQLLGGLNVPYESELQSLFGLTVGQSGLPNVSNPSATQFSGAPISATPAAANGFYFLNDLDVNPAAENLPSAGQHFDAKPAFDVNAVRKDFPILRDLVNGRPLIWLDNARPLKSRNVLLIGLLIFINTKIQIFTELAHELAARATDAYEEARETVRRFINAPSVNQVIFVRGTTEAINLVAKTWGKKHLGEGDEVLISHLEHHANIVPWQQLCAETGAKLKVAPVDDSGQVILAEYQKLLTSRVKLVSFTQVSNALGTVTPAKKMIEMAHANGSKVLLDGAQSVSHMRSDVQALDPDFFVFSGHKVFGPTGIGALYGKSDVLAEMPEWQGGGNMIQDVTFEKTVYHEAPNKFEAGTGNIADAVGLGAALQYVERIGIDNIARYEHELLVYATQAMSQVPGLHLIGTAQDKASVLSFTLDGFKSEEVGAALNQEGIAVRSGHHCAQPILRRFGVETTVRPSLAFYNTTDEVDLLANVLKRLTSNKVPSIS